MSHRLAPMLVVLALVGCGVSESDARRMLEDSRQAGRDLSYRGIQVRRYSLDGEDRTMTVRVHHAPRVEGLTSDDVLDPEALAARLREPDGLVTTAVREGLSDATRRGLDAHDPDEPLPDALLETLVAEIDGTLRRGPLADADALAGLPLPADLVQWLDAGPDGSETPRLNRRLLEASFPDEIAVGQGGTRYEATEPGSDRTWTHASARGPDVPWLRDVDLVLRSYRLVEEGGGEVAGRVVDIYRLKARMPERPSRRFWIDRETRLMLRDEGIDAEGRVFEARFFETIEYGVRPPLPGFEDSEPPRPLRRIACGRLSAETGFEPYWPRALPEGFRLIGCHVREGDRGGAVLLYGDGLAQIVISEWPSGEPAEPTDPADEVVVRRETRSGETRLGLRLNGTCIDVRSRTIGSNLLLDVVASLARGGDDQS